MELSWGIKLRSSSVAKISDSGFSSVRVKVDVSKIEFPSLSFKIVSDSASGTKFFKSSALAKISVSGFSSVSVKVDVSKIEFPSLSFKIESESVIPFFKTESTASMSERASAVVVSMLKFAGSLLSTSVLLTRVTFVEVVFPVSGSRTSACKWLFSSTLRFR